MTEEGRVIGLLLQKVEGEFAGPEDHDVCKKATLEINAAGLVHGDVKRYNFMSCTGEVLVCSVLNRYSIQPSCHHCYYRRGEVGRRPCKFTIHSLPGRLV